MRVLLVKLSSMGDLIHALPAIQDAARLKPGIEFDWVIDASFQEVATWHKSVKRIICTNHRFWRQNKWQTLVTGVLPKLVKQIRMQQYDLVIDGQTSYKSAIVTRFARGLRCGLCRNTAREYGAHLFYQRTVSVDKSLHAITRLRLLFAKLLHYNLNGMELNYNLDYSKFSKPPINLPAHFVVLIHNASWDSKLWPISYWQSLIKLICASGRFVLLPWHTRSEHTRAKLLAQTHQNAIMLAKTNLAEMAYIIAHADAAICADTGLSHLTAALKVPAVSLYGPTDSKLIGAEGKTQMHLQSKFACAPCYKSSCKFNGKAEVMPACFAEITPKLVWDNLQELLT